MYNGNEPQVCHTMHKEQMYGKQFCQILLMTQEPSVFGGLDVTNKGILADWRPKMETR